MPRYDLEKLRAADLGDDELLMQLINAKCRPGDEGPWLDFARRGLVGGFHLPLPMSLDELARLQADCPIPLLLADNTEAGANLADELGVPWTRTPMQMCLGAAGDEELAYQWGLAIGREFRAAGGHWILGPVLDLAMEPTATCVGCRALGADPALVGRLGAAIVRGLQANGLLTSAKHFPGKGRAASDTHIIERDLEVSLDTLEREEFAPYRHCIEHAALSGIMPSHIRANALDERDTALVSRPHLDYLVERMGFDGLFITDSIAMGGIVARYSEQDRYVRCVQAGNHTVIADPLVEPGRTLEHLRAGLADGRLTRAAVEPLVDRVLAAKRRLFLAPPPPTDIDYAAHEALSRRIAAAAVTEFRRPDAPAGVDTSKRLFVLVVSHQQEVGRSLEVQLDSTKQGEVAQAVRARLGDGHLVREIPAYPPSGNIAGCLRNSLRETDRTIVLASAFSGAFTGTAHLSRPVVNLLEGLASRIDAVVMIGNPYAALDLPPVPRVIFAYRGAHTIESALDVLFGQARATGKLPVPATPPGFA